jgi:hypothetical protein
MTSTAVASHGVTILVDDAIWPHRGRRWCHCVSDDDLDELHVFARRLDLPRRGFHGDHYDLPDEVRAVAVELGAVAVPSRELLRRLKAAGLRLSPDARRAWVAPQQRLVPGDWLGRIVEVEVDRPLGRRYALGEGSYPVNVGRHDDVDAYVLGPTEPVDVAQAEVIAVIQRLDDVEDRLVTATSGAWTADAIHFATAFHERLFRTRLVTAPVSARRKGAPG